MRIVDYALALDGGTQVITVETDDGEKITFGLDGRMNSPGAGKQLFIGKSPDSPDVRLLSVGGPEEQEVVSLLERWLDETQGFVRREALMDADEATLKSQDLLDRLALEFLSEIRSRELG